MAAAPVQNTSVLVRGLTLDEYQQLKDLAQRHGRSLGKEAMIAVREKLEKLGR